MRKEGLRALAVVHAPVADSRTRRPDGYISATATSIAVPVLGNLVHNLIEGGEDVVSELHLRNSRVASDGKTHSKACDRLLRNRRVKNSMSPMLLPQAHGASEDAAEGHILAKEYRPRVRSESDGERIVDGSNHGAILHRTRGCRRYPARPGVDERRLRWRHRPVQASVALHGVVAGIGSDVPFRVLPLLLKVPRQLVICVCEEVLQRPPLQRLPCLEGFHDLLPRIRMVGRLLRIIPDTLRGEVRAEPRDRPLLLE
mmetsp:Transcript_126980/g.270734  ORF Transcript_126980/g.270734 Transcript_126980/m.270734 type:complete len:257 (+) Transcript_126980:803-1573(+)